MFTPETIAFLADLKTNNRRDWFEANRARYERALAEPARLFAAELADRLSAASGAPVTARIYRLHRDLRFARDKTPYNAHLHLGFSGAGPGAWLVGLEPGRFVIGYGVMGFDPTALDRWRACVAGPEGAALAGILEGLTAQGLRLDPPELKRVPAPYPADHPRGDLLRRKSLLVWDDRQPMDSAFGPGAPARLAAALQGFDPLRTWLRAALA